MSSMTGLNNNDEQLVIEDVIDNPIVFPNPDTISLLVPAQLCYIMRTRICFQGINGLSDPAPNLRRQAADTFSSVRA